MPDIPMNYTVHVYLHSALDDQKLDQILQALKGIQGDQTKMADLIAQLIQDVTDETTLIDGLSTLVDGLVAAEQDLAAKLKAAGTDPTKIAAVHSALLANAQKLATKKQQITDALAANVVPPASSGPVISGITPTSGPGGTSVTITGSGFGATQGAGSVAFNGVPSGAATSWSDTSITATVPPSATTGNVVVATDGGVSSPGFPFTVG